MDVSNFLNNFFETLNIDLSSDELTSVSNLYQITLKGMEEANTEILGELDPVVEYHVKGIEGNE
jgi:hypothetical protein